MSILLALIKKELIQTLRDPRLRLVIFVMPMIQMIVFGFAISSDVKNLDTAILDQDRTQSSRELISTLERGGYFHITGYLENGKIAEENLLYNKSKIIVVIPSGFEKKLSRGVDSPVQILLDGSDSNSTGIALGYILRMFQETVQGGKSAAVPGFMLANVVPMVYRGPVLETRVWYNPELESRFFLIPGIITMIITIIVTLLTAMGITREKESGTFEQLIVSPILGWQLILGKTLPYLLLGMVDILLVAAVSKIVFSMPLAGPFWVFLLLNLIYIFVMLGLGLFISTISSGQQQAMLTVFALLFPFIILSGFFFPIENMPVFIQYITIFNPMKYSMSAQREVFLKGSGMDLLWKNIAVLLFFAVVLLGYGVIRFRRGLSA